MSAVFPLEGVLSRLRAGKSADIAGVDADLTAYVAVAMQARLGRPVVVVAPEASDARRVASDLEFFAGPDCRVVLLSTVEASPYGDLSPDRGAVMELMSQLSLLAWDQAGTFTVLSVDMLARRCVPRDVLVERSFLVVAGKRLERDACLRALADAGYHAVGTVEDPGTTLDMIESVFGTEIAELVDGVTKISSIKNRTRATAQAATLRKMLIATVKDVRVIII
jgi:transcription-repair coupling factor (superfamily II helicase)